MKVKFVKLRENAHVPTQGSEKSAGFDLYAAIDEQVVIREGSWMPIPTGLAITPPEGYFGAIFARSGLSIKKGLRPANCVGVCDEDYTGEYIVALRNDSDCTETVQPGDRIAQLVFLPYIDVEFEEVSSLDKTERGTGGFGSTGTN